MCLGYWIGIDKRGMTRLKEDLALLHVEVRKLRDHFDFMYRQFEESGLFDRSEHADKFKNLYAYYSRRVAKDYDEDYVNRETIGDDKNIDLQILVDRLSWMNREVVTSPEALVIDICRMYDGIEDLYR